MRFIYVNRLPWYLTVEPGRAVIEQPISGELDINGWDLRKTMQMLKASNPTLLGWLRSPIVYHPGYFSPLAGARPSIRRGAVIRRCSSPRPPSQV